MSDEKKKIKDLAAELGVSNKDLLDTAKDLGIQAKVAGSSVTSAEALRLRNRIAPPAEADKQQIKVRRRARVQEEEPVSAPLDQQTPQFPQSHVEQGASAPASVSAPLPEDQPPAPPVVAPAPAAAVSPENSGTEEQTGEGSEKAERGGHRKKKDAGAKIARPQQSARVVSLPDPTPKAPPVTESEPVTNEEKALKPEAKPRPETSAEARKTAGKTARAVSFSAEPERDAAGLAMSSLPNVGQSREHGEDFAATEGGAPKVPGARVISRAEDRPRREGPASRPPYRPAQGDAAGSRHYPGAAPASDRAGRPERPGGAFPPRPGGVFPPRPGGAFPPRPGGAFSPRPGGAFPGRPAGPGSPAPGFPPPPAPDGESRRPRRKGKRTVEFSDDRSRGLDDDQAFSRTQQRRKPRKSREIAPLGGTQPVKAAKRKIRVDEFIRVSDLAHQMGLKSGEIIKVLFGLGVMATINQSLDIETATLVAAEFDYEVEKTGFSENDIIEAQQDNFVDNAADYQQRPPVVTIMGHVDHGKTSLLDAVRKSSVAAGEAGGITQHIGAYHVKTRRGEIVFLDTPGHEAFTAMRARGAEITDIVVLVVAADDGVMEQTKEAINHARAAKVPIMVAVNKIDKEGANRERVQRELSEQGLVPEEWGGDTTFSYVSAKTRQGLDEFLEMLALQAEILELKANPSRTAVGHIVEAKLDKGRGSLGTVLIQQGSLRLGDAFICGVHSGRVRAMFNDQGKKVKEAGPSIPVEVQGFEGVPEAGEEFIVISDEKAARRIAEARALKQRERELAKESKVTLETFLARKDLGAEAEVLNLVIKADVQGSLEAISDALRKLSTDKVRINIMHGGTGAVSESDVLLSSASRAIILGFNVRPSSKAKELAEQEKVDIRFYDVIYKLVDEVRNAMQGMLAPVEKEVFLGTADVRELFTVPKFGVIAGCHVSDGKITRAARVRLLRDGVVVHNGKISSLRRFKDDVREVAKGYECGIGLDNFNDLKTGDVIEAFEIVEEAAVL
ncbi:MAG: translation initiation factor IF-2 [Desulfovibrio sp.]|jgi:translation initiation factor IF-2|nr:translation initiation factor IF-2 [Desulfovibrio sp.]